MMNVKKRLDPQPAPSFKLIDLKRSLPLSLNRWFINPVAVSIEKTLSIGRINSIYRGIVSGSAESDFFDKALDYLQVRFEVPPADIAKIPTAGPLVVVANHPFGGIEGVLLGSLFRKARPDLKILGNFLLQHIPEIRERIIPVDPFGRRSSVAANARAYREAIRWLKKGGAIITFPAGEVSHLQLTKGKVVDPEWSSHIGRIIRQTQATVQPVYFPGRNSMFFNFMGLLNARFRTVLLAHELANKSRKTLRAYIGKPLPWTHLEGFSSDLLLTSFLRLNTYFLKHRSGRKPIRINPLKLKASPPVPVAEPLPANRLEKEVKGLPPDQKLVAHHEFEVHFARAAQIPLLMQEIGRLRELSFREVQEGTGRAVDLDAFDDDYFHLFLWNRRTAEVVGAYRLGLTDVILRRRGLRGLYTNSLFRFKPDFPRELEHSIELGRSFIRTAYQRKHNCLALLWKGIGQFIIRNPEFTKLFGPVSISQNYHWVSKNLMVEFLRKHKMDSTLARRVKPRRPYRIWRGEERQMTPFLRDIEDVSLLVSEIERDGKGVPVLIKHYLKLNASFVSFNVDKDFCDVVDGLIVVDLLQTDARILRRFMGEKGFETFRNYQSLSARSAAVGADP